MYSRDYRDILGGALMILLGAAAALYAWVKYEVGTVREMGPGMFPVGLGIILVGLGALILIPALSRAGPKFPELETRPLLAISLAGLAFAACIETIGILPAVFVLTIVSAFGDTKLKLRGMLLLAASLGIFAALIFKVALDLPIHILRWPF